MKNYVTYDSPIGKLVLIGEDDALVGLHFKSKISQKLSQKLTPILQKTKKQLDEYFCGKRKNFDLKLNISGTDFQLNAWKHLQKIPFGKTISYAQQALSVGSEKAFRAVGSANGKNPIAIVVPCHRVIRADGTAGGYAGGINIKNFLIDHESKNLISKK